MFPPRGKREPSVSEVETMVLGYFRDFGAQLDKSCRRFCPHMPRLKISVEGNSVEFVLSNLESAECECNFRYVCKPTVVMKCEEGRARLKEVKSFYKFYTKTYGNRLPVPEDFIEKYATFVSELYSRLGIDL